MSKKLIYVAGPTGIGKTSLSIELAKKLKTDIISCDSRQFYKELKIGTSPPTNNQLNEIRPVSYTHLTLPTIYSL